MSLEKGGGGNCTFCPPLPTPLPYLIEFRELKEKFKKKQKSNNYDKHYRTHDYEVIPNETKVWITSEGERTEGKVVSPSDLPRSYMVVTPKGTVRRNRLHLNVDPSATVDFPDTDSSKTPEIPDDEPRRIMTRSQTGTETHYSHLIVCVRVPILLDSETTCDCG